MDPQRLGDHLVLVSSPGFTAFPVARHRIRWVEKTIGEDQTKPWIGLEIGCIRFPDSCQESTAFSSLRIGENKIKKIAWRHGRIHRHTDTGTNIVERFV